MRIEREELLRLDSSLRRAWLESDGVGGFAASTILLCATSQYHGLLVALPPGFNPHAALGDLATPLEAHRRALVVGDLRAMQAHLAPGVPGEVATVYERLPSPIGRVDVVGCARLGLYRVVKLRVAGPQGVVVLQERWVVADGTWRIALVEATNSSAPTP